MPNWCSNEVVVSGSPELIAEVLAIAPEGDDSFQMNKFVPMPEELRNTTAPQDSPNWYDWAHENWGTKWDMCDVYLSVHPSKAGFSISYNTAWAPNTPFWGKFSELYPTLSISHTYYEEGMCFIGEAEYKNGEIDDYCVEISDEMYSKAGAVFDENGEIDWDQSDVCLSDVFPLRRDKEMENA